MCVVGSRSIFLSCRPAIKGIIIIFDNGYSSRELFDPSRLLLASNPPDSIDKTNNFTSQNKGAARAVVVLDQF